MFAMRDKRDEIVDLFSIRKKPPQGRPTPVQGVIMLLVFLWLSVLSVSKGNLGDPTSDQAQDPYTARGLQFERIVNSATNK